MVEAEPGDAPEPTADPAADVLAWAHNETSTGVVVGVERPAGAGDALVLVDATSGAGGLPLDPSQADAYYFAPQKTFGSDGGIWLALLSPAAIERIAELDGVEGRWQPSFLSLQLARRELAQGPDLQHPGGGDPAAARRPDRVDARRPAGSTGASSARARPPATSTAGPSAPSTRRRSSATRPSARRSSARSTSTRPSTPSALAATLRANGIVDTEPYRKLGRNQLRIGMFPTIDPADVEALTACIDWVARERPGSRELSA